MLFGTVEAFSNSFIEHDSKTWEYCWKAMKKVNITTIIINLYRKLNKKYI